MKDIFFSEVITISVLLATFCQVYIFAIRLYDKYGSKYMPFNRSIIACSVTRAKSGRKSIYFPEIVYLKKIAMSLQYRDICYC